MDSPFKNIKVPTDSALSGWTPRIDINDPNLSIDGIIETFLPFAFGAAGIILLFMIIASGFSMMTSKGDPKVMQAAQGRLTTAVLGIFILFISFFVVQLVMRFLGISLEIIN